MHLVLFMTRGMSLTAWQQNGSLERELALYAELAKHGCKTSIISWGDQRDKTIAAQYPWLAVYVNRWRMPPQRYEKLMPFLHAWPLIRADIIKSNQINGSDCALRCARLWKKPFIARCGYIWSMLCENRGSSDLALAQHLECTAYSCCAHGIVTTDEAKNFLVEQYGIPSNKLTVIPNYVPQDYYTPPLPDYIRTPPFIITQVGRLSEEKNPFALITACAGLPVTLRLVGDGPLKENLQQHAERLGVSIEFCGTVPTAQLPALLAESAIVTLVSHHEGHPKALIEAMARGCAVLGTRVPGIAPLIEHERNGLLCSTDAASIRAGLKILLNDADLRARLGKQARESAACFRLAGVAARELETYHLLPRHNAIRKSFAAASCALKLLPRLSRKIMSRITLSHCVDVSLHCLTARLIAWQASRKPPADALRFLFDLEQQIYSLEGRQAVAYDGGIHTKHRHTQYHDFFVERLQPGERVLDIGCGNGFLACDMAAKGGGHVTGIELNAENVATARQKFSHPNIRFIHGDALKDLPSGAYDTVVLSNVLEHLPNRVDFLRKVRERLRPARFLLRVPLFERDWRVPLKKELGVEWRLDVTHETEYTQEQFACELACADLYITDFQIRWGEIWCEARSDVPYAQERHANPRVTVLMAVHNGEQYLETAVNSILRQTLRDFDFLIVDDASTDATPQMLANFAAKDARIQILTNETNLGLTASLNRGIAQIETPYIARMDADDISVPERLERQVAYMEKHPEIAVIGTAVGIFSSSNPVQVSPYVPPCPASIVRQRTFSIGPQITHPSAVLRTATVKSIGGYRDQFLCTQDYDLWLRLLDQYEIKNIPNILLFYRTHKNSVSSKYTTQQTINHCIAMISSENRRAGKSDPIEGKDITLDLLFELLNPSNNSYYAFLYYACFRNIENKPKTIKKIVSQLELTKVPIITEHQRKVLAETQKALKEKPDEYKTELYILQKLLTRKNHD